MRRGRRGLAVTSHGPGAQSEYRRRAGCLGLMTRLVTVTVTRDRDGLAGGCLQTRRRATVTGTGVAAAPCRGSGWLAAGARPVRPRASRGAAITGGRGTHLCRRPARARGSLAGGPAARAQPGLGLRRPSEAARGRLARRGRRAGLGAPTPSQSCQ